MYIGISNMIKTYVKGRFIDQNVRLINQNVRLIDQNVRLIDQNVRLIEDVIDYRTNNDTCGAIYL